MRITMSQKAALIRTHTMHFDQHIYSSSVKTMSSIGPKFSMKCVTISDKVLYWAIQTFSPGSLNDKWNTLVVHLE